jgi:hypothetical protein
MEHRKMQRSCESREGTIYSAKIYGIFPKRTKAVDEYFDYSQN